VRGSRGEFLDKARLGRWTVDGAVAWSSLAGEVVGGGKRRPGERNSELGGGEWRPRDRRKTTRCNGGFSDARRICRGRDMHKHPPSTP
jgi:hypothetical protein